MDDRMSTPRISAAQFRAGKKKQGRVRGVAPKEDRTYAGRVYHGKGEARFAEQLDQWKAAGAVESWEAQVPVRLSMHRADGTPGYCCTLEVDFRVVFTGGAVVWFEVKPPVLRAKPKRPGLLGAKIELAQGDALLKVKMFRAQFPEQRLVLIDSRTLKPREDKFVIDWQAVNALVAEHWVPRINPLIERLSSRAQKFTGDLFAPEVVAARRSARRPHEMVKALKDLEASRLGARRKP
jgi:hypothetical protein